MQVTNRKPLPPPLPTLEESRKAWKLRVRLSYRSQLRMGLVVAATLAVLAVWLLTPLFGSLAWGLGAAMLLVTPLLAAPIAFAEAGPYPTEEHHRRCEILRAAYLGLRAAEQAATGDAPPAGQDEARS